MISIQDFIQKSKNLQMNKKDNPVGVGVGRNRQKIWTGIYFTEEKNNNQQTSLVINISNQGIAT